MYIYNYNLLIITSFLEVDKDFNVVTREEPILSIQRSLVPIFVYTLHESNQISLPKAQFTLIFWLEIEHRPATRLASYRLKRDCNIKTTKRSGCVLYKTA